MHQQLFFLDITRCLRLYISKVTKFQYIYIYAPLDFIYAWRNFVVVWYLVQPASIQIKYAVKTKSFYSLKQHDNDNNNNDKENTLKMKLI